MKFIESWPIGARTQTGIFFCHSIPESAILENAARVFASDHVAFEMVKGGFIYELTWGRDLSLETTEALCEITGTRFVVVGHKGCPEGWELANPKCLVLDSAHERGKYLHIPLDRELDADEIVAGVKPITLEDEPFTWEPG
jgi:hypothetical protein